jgi:hypothetical protein
MKNLNPYKGYFVLVFQFVFFNFVYAQSQFNDNFFLNCKQSTDKTVLQCDYRQTAPEPLLGISAKSGNTKLTVTEDFTYPKQGGISAILFLVDTSDPARQSVIQKNIQHVQKFLKSAGEQHRLGLASFDRSFRIEAPIGSTHEQIMNAAQKLRAIGKTTELYRSMLQAIKLLEHIDADRKSIFLFSDGLAEDKAYFHKDVVNAARKAGVIVTGLGYPRSISQSVALQTLRRISEDTGGAFIEADNNFNLPQGFINQTYNSIDNGGQITIGLQQLFTKVTSVDNQLILTFETDTRETTIAIPISIPYEPKQKIIETKVVQVPHTPQSQTSKSPVKIVTVQSPQERTLSTWLWYGIPVALLVLILLTIATFFTTLKRTGVKQGKEKNNFYDFKPYAYLVVQDETKQRYPITRTTCRIGRSKDNELTLRDNSISRRHAEIHRDKGEIFTLIDLSSLNGVYVNNVKIKKHRLHEGDILEIGDVILRFTLHSIAYEQEDSTVVQDTKVPMTH